MSCCHSSTDQCAGIEQIFDARTAQSDLRDYLKNGPGQTTRWLLDAIADVLQSQIRGASLLDIGGGVGVLQHELARAGVSQVVGVDASTAYINTAKNEAAQRGYAARYTQGNFVDVAADVAEADIVTLERVICCYPDMQALVRLSSARAKKVYGVVYPRSVWWMRLGRDVLNGVMFLLRRKFRFFVHRTEDVEALLLENGLVRRFYRASWVWQVVVYERRC
jgi:magnesium-protoporphyrin O-methyltransferase